MSAFSWSGVYIDIYILNTLSGGKSCLVVRGEAVPPWATETVLSPWLATDEDRISHIVWKKIYIYTPPTFFHSLSLSIYIYIYIYINILKDCSIYRERVTIFISIYLYGQVLSWIDRYKNIIDIQSNPFL